MKSAFVDNSKTAKKITYPILMKSHGEIVLFTGSETGTVVHTLCGTHKLGEYRQDWIPTAFEPLSKDDSVCLSN